MSGRPASRPPRPQSGSATRWTVVGVTAVLGDFLSPAAWRRHTPAALRHRDGTAASTSAGVGCERRLTDPVPPLSVQLALTAQPDAQDSGLVVKCGALGAEIGLCAGELAA
jgi:hypothetical protein